MVLTLLVSLSPFALLQMAGLLVLEKREGERELMLLLFGTETRVMNRSTTCKTKSKETIHNSAYLNCRLKAWNCDNTQE